MISNKIFLYNLVLLARLNKPIGIFLLLWPSLTALWLASNDTPDFKLIIIFILGTILMRSAGCVVNDIADQKFDKHVLRTNNRPLVLKSISNQTAFKFLFLLLVLSFFLVLQLNFYTFCLSLLALLFALLYPFTKRFFVIPQFFLGITFSFGILMAFTATQNMIPMEGWMLFFANLFWVLGYDSHYALVDLEDDKNIPINSSAKTFGRLTPFFISICFITMYLIYLYLGIKNQYSYVFYLFIFISLFITSYGMFLGYKDSILGNFKAFKVHNYVGFFIFLAIFSQM